MVSSSEDLVSSSEEDARLRTRVVGTYRLLYAENYADDGEILRGFGDHPRGFMVYTADGVTICLLMKPGRASSASPDLGGGTTDEKVMAYDSSASHAGTWEVAGGKIIHHLTANTYPNWTDTHQARDFEVSDTHLTLWVPSMLSGGKWREGATYWERVDSHTDVPLSPRFGDRRDAR